MLHGIVDKQTAVITWVPPACDATRYVVKQRSPGSNTWKEVCCSPNPFQTFYEAKGLADGEHEFTVAAAFTDGTVTKQSPMLTIKAPMDQNGKCAASCNVVNGTTQGPSLTHSSGDVKVCITFTLV